MTRYYKVIENGYITGIGTGHGGTEIDGEEYAEILAAIRTKPEAGAGYDWRLKENLTWEQYELPPVETADGDDGEISDGEALDIITGGTDG